MKKTLSLTTFFSVIALANHPVAAQDLRVLKMQGPCPVSGATSQAPKESVAGASAILASVGAKAVSAGIDKLIRVLSPEDRTLKAKMRIDSFYTRNGEAHRSLGCLIISYGKLGDAPADFSKRFDGVLKAPAANAFDSLKTQLPLSDIPDFYAEAVLELSPDKTAFTWSPRYVYFGEFFQKNWFAGNERDLQVQIDLYKPGQQEADRSTSWQWTAVRPPVIATKSTLLPDSEWMPIPERPETLSTAAVPYTMKVTIVETAKPYKLANYLSEAIKENKDTLQKNILEVIVSEKDKKDKAEGDKADSGV